MPTVPLCCGVEPHCAQKGLLDAGGGPEIFIPPDEPPPHPVIESIIPSNANPASRWGVIKRGRVDIAGLQILVALGDAGFSIFATSRGVYHREERTETRRKCVNSQGLHFPNMPRKAATSRTAVEEPGAPDPAEAVPVQNLGAGKKTARKGP